MDIAIFNVKHSPNLGDGIIAECLEAALTARPGVRVRAIDLAGRESYGSGSGAGRSRLLDFLHALPRPVSHGLVRLLLGTLVRVRLRPRWREALRGCDAAIVGGGQLISDIDLNFPLKLAAAAGECRRRRLPIAVFAVGVKPDWTRAGRRLLLTLFGADTIMAAVRDERSREALCRLLGPRGPGAPEPTLCRDPGLLAAEVYPRAPGPRRTRPLVGVGITHPAVLRHHADAQERSTVWDERAYAELILGLWRAGYDVLCFTNGAGEDHACLDAVRARIEAVKAVPAQSIAFLDRPRRPADLARIIAACDAVVGHRLHAHIVAYSYAIPSVGLPWDGKLAAFLASTRREAFLAAQGATPPRMIADLLAAALRAGIEPETRAAAVEETRRAIARLAETLRVESERRRCTALRASRPAPARPTRPRFLSYRERGPV